MDELEEKAIRFDLFKRNFRFAFEKLDVRFKTNNKVEFVLDEDWNLFARLNGDKLFFVPSKGFWMKVS